MYDTDAKTSGMTVGYARIQANSDSTTPAGHLIFSLRQNGVLVSETTVPEVKPMRSGRIQAVMLPAVTTGVAMVNPNSTDAVVSFYFTPGSQFCDCPAGLSGTFTLPAHSQIARWINQDPFGASFTPAVGTMTFSSNVPIGVIALRGRTNQRREFLMTTLPVADLNETPSTEVVFFPHYADGGGWTTEVILINPTDTTISGTVQFLGPGGQTKQY
jgi:hypothetical protein